MNSIESKKTEAQKKITQLVAKYEDEKLKNHLQEYTEAETKTGFIEPLFQALGWDTQNRNEVGLETTLSNGRVDYSFKLHGHIKLFVEAKPIRADLNKPEYAQQAVGYAWHKGVVWTVLTDFEGIKVFNAEWKSKDINQNLFFELKYDEFLTKFEQLWLLSKDAVEAGLLDAEAEKWGKKIKRQPISQQILSDFLEARKKLSFNITGQKGNKLDELELDEAVQRILDRFIFIRTCEDRLIEQPGALQSIARNANAWKHLVELFHKFDELYNSKLFEKHLCDSLDIEDSVVKQVIELLYHTSDCSVFYNFADINADVLGNIYEQYLGHILKKTKKSANLKKISQHRKEQGIYYTPTFIVDFIVKNTLTEVLGNVKPKDFKKLRVLDPACGSGSFLIRAFDELIRHYRKIDPSGFEYYIKTEILKNNVYGVDLDKQAVEITHVNLLLKTLQHHQRLPYLKNIRVGNSLIDNKEIVREKAFSWEKEFPEVIKDEGFDVIIGNPPYIRNRELAAAEKGFMKERYKVADGQFDIYQLFFEKSIGLLKDGGLLGMITSNKYAITSYGKKLRKYILDTCQILSIVDVSNLGVFRGAATYPYIIILKKEASKNKRNNTRIRTIKAESESDLVSGKVIEILQSDFLENPGFEFNITGAPEQAILIKKLQVKSLPLGEVVTIKETVHTGNVRAKLILDANNGSAKKLLRGKDCQRYHYIWNNLWIDLAPGSIDREKGEYATIPDPAYFSKPKLFLREIAEKITACYDEDGYYSLNKAYVLNQKDKRIPLKYVLGLLNSKVLCWFFKSKFETAHVQGGHLQFKKQYTGQLPIKDAPEGDKEKVVSMVDKLNELNARLVHMGDKKLDERSRLEREIFAAERELDIIVYRIYGLTPEEIETVGRD